MIKIRLFVLFLSFRRFCVFYFSENFPEFPTPPSPAQPQKWAEVDRSSIFPPILAETPQLLSLRTFPDKMPVFATEETGPGHCRSAVISATIALSSLSPALIFERGLLPLLGLGANCIYFLLLA